MYVLMPFVWNAEVESWMHVLTKDRVVFLARLKKGNPGQIPL